MANTILKIDDEHSAKLEKPFNKSPHLELLLEKITPAGGVAVLVGGSVRDHLLGIEHTDLDLEVYGIEAEKLEKILMKHFAIMVVGKAFGIFMVMVSINGERQSFDVSLPRSENKIGRGHKGFMVNTDPHMSFYDASSRRDFRVNAMGIDLSTDTLLDPHKGRQDLKNKILRHVSDAFSEDPLRVLRAAQFCARFGFSLADDTKKLCIKLRPEIDSLSCERIYGEMKKLLLARKPSKGLKVLQDTKCLDLFPELLALVGCQQDQEWHPEGDVWTHSLMVTDEAAKLVATSSLDEDDKLVIMAGALCHDLGKPDTSFSKEGRVKSPGHEQAGIAPTLSFLNRIGFKKSLHNQVCALVAEHLKPFQLYANKDNVSDGAIRRLCSRVNVEQLLYVSQADFLGRTTEDALKGFDPSAPWLRQRVRDLLGEDLAPKPIILGRHLMALGEKPGPHFGALLKKAFDAQLDGEFDNETDGIEWLKKSK